MAIEMGKNLREGRGEVEKCAVICDYYAENAENFLKPEPVELGLKGPGERAFITFNPLGVVFIVMPWNFPFWQVFRQAATALSAGNTMVMKHASNVFGCAAAIEQCFEEAGFPRDVFRNLPISGSQADAVIGNPLVRAVALTGSTPVGKQIGKRAGELLKPVVLELGGADPYLILDDADVAKAVSSCTAGRLLNCGQSCIGAKRFIVTDAVYSEFIAGFVKQIDSVNAKMGDPLDESTLLGPMCTVKARDEVHQQVLDSVAKGAKILCGGVLPTHSSLVKGSFYPATVLVDVKSGCGMPAYEQEIFGPVASVIRVRDEAEAIKVANDTPFGLGAAVFTRDLARGARIASEEIDAGLCFVNDFVKSDPRYPFGGAKESGVGRECSHYGLKEFVNIKTVVVKQ